MNEDEIMKRADALLKGIPELKKRFQGVKNKLKDNNLSEDKIKELIDEREYIKAELTRIVKALEKLEDVDQRIICYKYVDGFSEDAISSMTGYSVGTIFIKLSEAIPQEVGKIIYRVGRG